MKDEDTEFKDDLLENHDYQIDKKLERTKRRRNKKILNYRDKIKPVLPKTENQSKLFDSFFRERHILLHGCAGTGKSYCAIYLALYELFYGKYDKIIILRSSVPTRDIGFLPGTLEEKINLYESPYEEIVDDLLHRKGAYNDLKKDEVLEFKNTSFLRGLTWTNSLVIIDEAQNCTWHEMCSLVTRIGEGSRLIILGDVDQNDLNHQRKTEKSGLESAILVCQNMNSFDVIEFGVDDILRSDFVKEFLTIKKKLKL